MFPCVTALYRGLCCHPRWRIPLWTKNIATNFTGRNLLTFCTFVLVAGGSSTVSFFFFSDQYIFPNFKVDRNLISRLGILLTELNFHWNMIVMEKNRDRVGDDSKSKGKPRARKTTPSWFFNAKRFHNRMARPGFLLFFRGDSSFFSFFYESTRNILLSLSTRSSPVIIFFR